MQTQLSFNQTQLILNVLKLYHHCRDSSRSRFEISKSRDLGLFSHLDLDLDLENFRLEIWFCDKNFFFHWILGQFYVRDLRFNFTKKFFQEFLWFLIGEYIYIYCEVTFTSYMYYFLTLFQIQENCIDGRINQWCHSIILIYLFSFLLFSRVMLFICFLFIYTHRRCT